MRMRGRWKLLTAGAVLGALAVACALHPPPAGVPANAAPTAAAPGTLAPHLGAPYDIVAQESLLTILVYRGGTLATAGHNHVIASHDLSGTIYVPADPLQASFELHVPVATLTVDETALRAQQPSADFPPDVSEGARQGTRHNMLGPALLDAEHSPEIVLRALRTEQSTDAAGVLARVECTVRGQPHTLTVPVHYERGRGEVAISGELPLKQSDLGLTPFSALLGALQVQDEMRVSFRIVAREAMPRAQ
jgi:polyisoprenoid-binding protein YceI